MDEPTELNSYDNLVNHSGKELLYIIANNSKQIRKDTKTIKDILVIYCAITLLGLLLWILFLITK